MKRFFENLTVLLIAVCLLLNPDAAIQGISVGLHRCATALIPALFPFFVLSEFWIRRGHSQTVSQILGPLFKKLFHISQTAAPAIVLGMIGGYPVGALTAAKLYDRNELSKEDAELAVFFCNNAGPAFIVCVVGVGIFGSTTYGLMLYGIHLLTALLLGILFRPKYQPPNVPSVSIIHPESFSCAITASIQSAGRTILQVCMFVLLFSVVLAFISNIIGATPVMLAGLLELSAGASILTQGDSSIAVKWILSAGFLGFGGLCVLLQSMAALQEVGLSVKSMVKGKLLHGCFSAMVATVTVPFLPNTLPCFYSTRRNPAIIMLLPVFLIIWLAFLKKTSGKQVNNPV